MKTVTGKTVKTMTMNYIKKINGFCTKIKKKWKAANHTMSIFELKYKNWLKQQFHFPKNVQKFINADCYN